MIYQAVYIDKNRFGADQVVFIEPIVEDYNTAFYVLQSYKYSVYPGIIIQSPDEKSAQMLSDDIDKFSKNIKVSDYIGLYYELREFLQNQKDIIIMWERKPVESSVLAARVPIPTEIMMPVGINTKAKNIWKYIIRNYREKIRSYSNIEEQWAVAIIIFKRVCYKNNLRPFSVIPISKKSSDVLEEERDKLVKKIQTGYERAEMLISAIVDNFKSYGWVSRLDDKWQYNGVEKATRFSAMLFKDLVLAQDKTYKEINNYLNKNEGFKKLSYEDAELNIDSITSVIFQKHKSKTNYEYVIIKFSFDKKILAVLLGLDEKSTNDEFMKSMNRWVKDKYVV
jgi:hypothetical protein